MARLVDTGDSDCTVSSDPAAYCSAPPADDDYSSCRLGILFQTDRVMSRVGTALRCALGRRKSIVEGFSGPQFQHIESRRGYSSQEIYSKDSRFRLWLVECRMGRVVVVVLIKLWRPKEAD